MIPAQDWYLVRFNAYIDDDPPIELVPVPGFTGTGDDSLNALFPPQPGDQYLERATGADYLSANDSWGFHALYHLSQLRKPRIIHKIKSSYIDFLDTSDLDTSERLHYTVIVESLINDEIERTINESRR